MLQLCSDLQTGEPASICPFKIYFQHGAEEICKRKSDLVADPQHGKLAWEDSIITVTSVADKQRLSGGLSVITNSS